MMPTSQKTSQNSLATTLVLGASAAVAALTVPTINQTVVRPTRLEVVVSASQTIEWPYMANPRDDLNNTLSELVSSGLLLDANFQEIEDRYWEIYAKMSEEKYYKRNMRLAVIEKITNAIDRRYKIYTDIHIRPVPQNADQRKA